MMKSLVYKLRCLHGKMYEWLLAKRKKIRFCCELAVPFSSKIYIIGTPEHKNLGDSAIVIAQKFFCEMCGYEVRRVKEITLRDYEMYRKEIVRIIRLDSKAVCCLLGGGNMGDVWLAEEYFRREVMEDLSGKQIIIFPQTIFYTDSEIGKREQLKSVPYYNYSSGLSLCAREQTSFRLMKKLYPSASVLLVPDFVLSMKKENFNVEPQVRKGILLCFRSDIERILTDKDLLEIKKILRLQGYSYKETDMKCEQEVTKETRIECVRQKLEQFTRSELVITDRLHGMVFSTIAETPCIVLSNNNHKVKGTYDWISYLPYVQYADSLEDVFNYIPELLKMTDCKYDNSPLLSYYKALERLVVEVRNSAID